MNPTEPKAVHRVLLVDDVLLFRFESQAHVRAASKVEKLSEFDSKVAYLLPERRAGK